MTSARRGFDRDVPSPARMYDYYLGGKDNFPADREAADAVIAASPHLPRLARNNRTFLVRSVGFIAQQGVDQFIDIGTGVPTSPNVHEVVREIHPDARIVYVDNDPVVLAHDRALLASDDRITIVDGDMLDPEAILADPGLQAAIDFDRPIGVLCVAVLHFSRDRHPRELLAPFRERMAPGSYVAVSHVTSEGLTPEQVADIEEAYRRTPNGARLRTHEQIGATFEGFDLVEPGLVDVSQWRSEDQPTEIRILAGVGRRA